ncbi:uncharacterized protein F5Z01DRAFT_350650 [Emericellopsis atlantica]|uniref:Uncharacterized protein n=1 Tax=Emericellopsis atlantica TaxID=2614577 RepID=A0A9P7ZFC4_9HYPO|nr:uncharacterized protein F5Z01DRAFT_350650 [Emericellopsis atlantica]KAG9250637.1 hypothetical protein F5Z01DRAFT_350650 [Emericellopsis atlantica]
MVFHQDVERTTWSLPMTEPSLLGPKRRELRKCRAQTSCTSSWARLAEEDWENREAREATGSGAVEPSVLSPETKDDYPPDPELPTARSSSQRPGSELGFAPEPHGINVGPRSPGQVRIDSWSTINESNHDEGSPSTASTDSHSRFSWVSGSGTIGMDSVARENQKSFPPRTPLDPRPLDAEARAAKTLRVRSWISKQSPTGHDKSNLQLHSPESSENEDLDHDAVSTTSEAPSSSAVSSHDAESINRGVQHYWRKMKTHQARIQKLSKHLGEVNKRLGKIRPKLRVAANDFMKELRTTSHQKQLLSSDDLVRIVWAGLPRMQRLQDVTFSLEEALDDLRQQLSKEQKLFSKAEVQFYSLLGHDMDESSTESTYESSEASLDASEPDTDLLGIPMARSTNDNHPLFQDLESAIGQYLSIMMYLQDARDNKAVLQDIVDRRTALGAPISEETRDGLDETVSNEARYLKLVNSKLAVINDLKQKTMARDVLSARTTTRVASVLYRDDNTETEPAENGGTHQPETNKVVVPNFLKLLWPAYRLPTTAASGKEDNRQDMRPEERHGQTSYPQLLMGQSCSLNRAREDGAHFINEWMLDQVRESRRNADKLFVNFTHRLTVRSPGTWQNDVLKYWHRDGTDKIMKEAEACYSAYYHTGHESDILPSRRASHKGATPRALKQETEPTRSQVPSSRASRRSRTRSVGW